MTVKRITADEARDLVDREGYTYVDVRSVPEFEAGHPAGAYNVPLLHAGPLGLAENHDFLKVMEKTFPPEARIVVGCQGGGRSLRAAAVLRAAGYQDVVDQRCGFMGNSAGEPGWKPRGLPVSRDAEPGRAWAELAEKAR